MTPTPETRKARVRLIGDHPWRGESGTLRLDQPTVMGMALVDMDNGKECYAPPHQLRRLPSDEDRESAP